jgi:hypothetical protein
MTSERDVAAKIWKVRLAIELSYISSDIAFNQTLSRPLSLRTSLELMTPVLDDGPMLSLRAAMFERRDGTVAIRRSGPHVPVYELWLHGFTSLKVELRVFWVRLNRL